MSGFLPANLFSNLRGDLFGGVTAAVVALPLALAFGVASGAGPAAGLYGAIAVGFFSAFFGGTPAQISGPTGPMTVVMAAVIAQYQHDLALVFTVVVLGGAIQVLFGILKIGRYITFMPYPVISGFMSGIGVIIIILQLGALAGHDSESGILQALTGLWDIWRAPNWSAAGIGVTALGVMLAMPKKLRVWVPPPLAALVVGTALGIFVLHGSPTLGSIPEGLPVPRLPSFDLHAFSGMLSSALILALLGSIDSLLTSLVADNFTRSQHNSDKELIGQGVGNIAAGLIGGLPGAGATMRTVVNIRSGGRTPLSGMVHSLVLLACMLGLGFLVEDIPKAALAGILLKVGWDIIDWPFLDRIRHAGLKGADRSAVVVMLAVFGLTVFVDLIMAVAIGVIMKSLITARRLATHQIKDVDFITGGGGAGVRHRLSEEEEAVIDSANGQILLLRFTGPLSFGTARDLSSRLENIYESYGAVVIDFTDARMMDISIMLTLADMVERMAKAGKAVFVSGTGNAVYTGVKTHGCLKDIPAARHMPERRDALFAAAESLGSD